MGNLLKISVSSSNVIFLLFKNASFKKYLQHHEIITFDLDMHQQLPVGRRVRKNCKLEQKKFKKKMEQTQGSPGFPRIWLGFLKCWFYLLMIMILVFIFISLDFASSPQKFGHNQCLGESFFFYRKWNHSLKNFSFPGFSRFRHFQVSDTIINLL